MKKAKKFILWVLAFSMLISVFSVAALPAAASSAYSFEAAKGEYWSSNSKRAMNRSYTVSVDEGEPQTFSMWIMTPDIGNPLRVYSPEIELDTSACTSAKISAEFWRNEKEGDPDPECNMTIYYSVDGGKTWAGTLDCSVEKTERKAICDQDTTIFGYIHELTTGDICEQLPDTVITNLKLVPFEGVQTGGAFRILDICIETEGSSLTVKGAASVDIANDTDPVIEPTKPIEPTSMVYSFEENAGEFWSSNSKRAMNRSYTVSVDEGEPQTFSMWIMTPDIGNPLRVYSPEIELDTSFAKVGQTD